MSEAMRDLGPLERTFRASIARSYNYLVAAMVCVGAGSWLVQRGLAGESRALGSIVGGALLLLVGLWMVKEFTQLRRVKFEVFAKGMSTADGLRFGWDEVTAIEARYVPGLRKTGTADAENIASAYLTTRGARAPVILPREFGPTALTEFLQLVSTRTGLEVKKVLIADLSEQ